MIVELKEKGEALGIYEVRSCKEAITCLAEEEGYDSAEEFLKETGRRIHACHLEALAAGAIHDILNGLLSLQTEIEQMEASLDELSEVLKKAEDPSDDYVSVQEDASEIVSLLKGVVNSSGDLLQKMENTGLKKSFLATFTSS